MIALVSKLISRAMMAFKAHPISTTAGGLTTGLAISDFINIDFLRRAALEIAPGSDREALEEAARLAARLLGLEGDEILWPRQRSGEPIVPHYLIIDLNRGRGWFSTRYYSRKSVKGARRNALRPRVRVTAR